MEGGKAQKAETVGCHNSARASEGGNGSASPERPTSIYGEGLSSASGKEAALSTQEAEPSLQAIHRRISRKADMRLLPLVVLLYALSLIDRTNLAGARISGIDAALGLNLGNRYSVVLSIFYIGYVLFELPSNIVLKKAGAPLWLSILALLFGVITLGIGFAKNYATLVALRILLGTLEAGLFPGCLYLMAAWYPRYELQKRVAIFFTGATLLSSFANILSYGLTQIADEPEINGWEYIFIVQGAITIGIAIINFIFLPEFPESKRGNKFLSADEKEALVSRLISERGDAESGKVTWKVVKDVCLAWHTWTVGFVYIGGSCSLYSFLFFLPVILRNSFGFTTVMAFCLSAPPAAFSVFYSLAMSWFADRVHQRGVFVISNSVVAVAGLALTGFLNPPAGRYVGTFLGMGGSTALVSSALAWGQNNVRLDSRRSVLTVTQAVFAAIGGIYSAQVFRQQDAPDYTPGIIATGALLLFNAFLSILSVYFLRRENQKADRGEIMIEESVEFRYTL
ncbi:related to putative tartrate transporter [Cephalotrichum gorgonifer]|uniref:Related to putative tartrate transporter n=1 Tax=Cephalotrichum gorgonifer TaxID=2041049 RepID=A0AAE8N0S1_9PEZI|nr:related to putative tartrate transporter [Cephalotrichum gorgonifer]